MNRKNSDDFSTPLMMHSLDLETGRYGKPSTGIGVRFEENLIQTFGFNLQ